MKIYTDTPEGVTVVKNAFIDQYMPQANGEFVKVYLYLLRCADTDRELTLSAIADVLDLTEKDVQRALLYWEKQELIHLKGNRQGELQSITFSDLTETDALLSASTTQHPGRTNRYSAANAGDVPGRAGGSTAANASGIPGRADSYPAANASGVSGRAGGYPSANTSGISGQPNSFSGPNASSVPGRTDRFPTANNGGLQPKGIPGSDTGANKPQTLAGSRGMNGTAPEYSGAGAAEHLAFSERPEAQTAPAISKERMEELCEQQEIRQLFFVAEQYLQRPLTSSEQTDFLYYYDTLHFSADLIDYLLEYCLSKKAFSRHYMRRVALSWAEAGISTVAQAKQESSLYNKNYYIVLNTFGIKGRSPGKSETELMSRWFDEYKMPLEIVVEACSRTIGQIHQPSFAYADKILKKWYDSHVTSLEDVKKIDQQRSDRQQRRNSASKPDTNQPRATGNRFNNFSQRDYDYNELERKLLGGS